MTDLYASEEESNALIQPDTRTPKQKKLDKLAEKYWMNEQGIEPQRKPLTDEQRREIAFRWRDGNGTASEIIDMVEAAHGIRENK